MKEIKRRQVNFRATGQDERDLATIRSEYGVTGNTKPVRLAIRNFAQTIRRERKAMQG